MFKESAETRLEKISFGKFASWLREEYNYLPHAILKTPRNNDVDDHLLGATFTVFGFFRLLYSFHNLFFGFPLFFGLSTTEEK
jgi:hypothetical protein